MNEPDLSQLLRQWRDIEPRSKFEANVRRRIRLAVTEPVREPWWFGLFWRPAFSVTAALVIAITIGAWSGTRSVSRPEATGFLAHDTLTARYLGLSQ